MNQECGQHDLALLDGRGLCEGDFVLTEAPYAL
jgi:hypothetical protein